MRHRNNRLGCGEPEPVQTLAACGAARYSEPCGSGTRDCGRCTSGTIPRECLRDRCHGSRASCLHEATHPRSADAPGFRLHPLKGDRAGQWSVRVSGNWRVVLRFEDGEDFEILGAKGEEFAGLRREQRGGEHEARIDRPLPKSRVGAVTR